MYPSSKLTPSREKKALSNSYIDENGQLFLHETAFENKIKQFVFLFRELPPILSFLAISFFLVQLYLIFGGLYYHQNTPPTSAELRTYIFLFIFLGAGVAGCLKLGWFFMEQKDAEYNDIQEQYQNNNSSMY
ncbi:MAG TPA: hypothetical protein DCR35_20940 [Runella sp.]|nr:hypothetical protein [Runella sp.]HAO51565.1 hypothetical protein [Runella sp.]